VEVECELTGVNRPLPGRRLFYQALMGS